MRGRRTDTQYGGLMRSGQSLSRRATLAIGFSAGIAAGVGSGLFGIGGGLIVVPILVLALHLDQKLASGTSVASIVVSASAAAVPFLLGGEADLVVAALMFGGGALGAVAGARLLDRLSGRVVGIVFVTVVTIAAIRLFTTTSAPPTGSIDVGLGGALALIAVGGAAGILAALLGIGGGIVFVPALTILFGAPQHLAQGTSLAAIVPTTLVAAVAHARADRIDWPLAGIIGAGGVLSGSLSGVLALATAPDTLRRLFALLLIVVAVRMLMRLRQS